MIATSSLPSATPYLASFSTGLASSPRTSLTLQDCQMEACIEDIITTTYPLPACTPRVVHKANIPCHEAAPTVTCGGVGETWSCARIPRSTPVFASADTEQREARDESVSTGVILGATLGPVAFLILVGGLIWLCQRCAKGAEEGERGDGRGEGWSSAATDGSSHWGGY